MRWPGISPGDRTHGWPNLRTALFGLALCFNCVAQDSPHLQIWRLEAGRLEPRPNATEAPLAVGSLQKPFVAQAWAEAHPDQAPPRLRCSSDSGCWRRGGHGDLGLVQATAVSCNAYFLHLAAATPLPILASNLERAGFQGVPHSPEAAIGLADGYPQLVIRPAVLLEAYGRLVRTPWATGESVRQLVLAGMREAALTGTAGALQRRGFFAKTGTVPSTTGNPLQTCGLALAVEDTGWAVLARLEPGTSREAASALAAPLAAERPWSAAREIRTQGAKVPPPASGTPYLAPIQKAERSTPSEHEIRVKLFDLLHPRRWKARNLGTTPIPSSQGGFLGPGATQELSAGNWLGPGLLEIEAVGTGLRRQVQGSLHASATRTLIATMTLREYADGVLAAELPASSESRRLELGAAVLRFLAQGSRHAEAEVCDSTHCAWFIGRGPRMEWVSPSFAAPPSLKQQPPQRAINDQEWNAMQTEARLPGPSQWSSHCGGQPLSSHALWGNGDQKTQPCSRHARATASWSRTWKSSDLAKAFGEPVAKLSTGDPEDTWKLLVTGSQGTRAFGYDEAHRRLARVLGWDALPSPASGITPIPGGYRVDGVGSGHRVGLCLGD